MKKMLSTLCCVLCTLCCVLHTFPAQAGLSIDFYAGGTLSMGNNITLIPTDTSLPSVKDWKSTSNSFGLILGIDIPIIRVEAEYDYLVSRRISLHTGMLNAYLKLLPTPFVQPYIGAGIGTVFGGDIGGIVDKSAETSAPA